jgi:hypothetical protein
MVELDTADGDGETGASRDGERAGRPASDEENHEVDEATDGEARQDAHLDEVADGCGCTEIWEHLSEQREG